MQNVNLLLVDDEPDVLELWKIHFDDPVFRIFEARDGSAALKIVEEIRNHDEQNLTIVFLDIQMPGINGIELLDILKQEMPAARIFIITGNIEHSEIPEAAYSTGKLGGEGFLQKSKIDFDALKDEINTFIEAERRRHQKAEEIREALDKIGTKTKLKKPYKI